MIHNITFPHLKTSCLLLAFLCFSVMASAQIKWTGSGDGTSWNDALNWQPSMVPPADSLVQINKDAVVTGTATVAPVRLSIGGSSDVVFNLNLSLGNGVTDDHALVIGAKCTVTFGEGFTFNLNPKDTKNAINTFASSDSATVNVKPGAVVNILKGANGLNLMGTNGTFNNEGTINCANAVKNGLRTIANVSNLGTMNFNANVTDAVLVLGGVFENSGEITVTTPGDDGLEISGNATFYNEGMLNLTAKDSAGTANLALSVGLDTIGGTFYNFPLGTITAHGGAKEIGRALSVGQMGNFSNEGFVLLTGAPNGTSRLYSKGTTVNGFNAILDMSDGRGNINKGTLTNNGLIKSSRQGAGLFISDSINVSVYNNAFFDYNMSNIFAAGAGTVINLGISVNAPFQTKINALDGCTVDIAEAPYTWNEGNSLIGTATATGSLTFPALSASGDSVVLTTSIPDVFITVINLCAAAQQSSSVFDPAPATETVVVYPSVTTANSTVNLVLPETIGGDASLVFEIRNVNGQVIDAPVFQGGGTHTLAIRQLPAGMYFLNGRTEKGNLTGRFYVTAQ